MKVVVYEETQKKISMLEKTFVFCGDREHEVLGFKEIRRFMMSREKEYTINDSTSPQIAIIAPPLIIVAWFVTS